MNDLLLSSELSFDLHFTLSKILSNFLASSQSFVTVWQHNNKKHGRQQNCYCACPGSTTFAEPGLLPNTVKILVDRSPQQDRRSHCSSKTVLLIPFSKQSLLLIAANKAPIANLNVIVINSLLTKDVQRFQMSPFLVFTMKTDRFQNALFSNLCVFISVSEKPRFHSGAIWTQGKNGEVLPRFHL